MKNSIRRKFHILVFSILISMVSVMSGLKTQAADTRTDRFNSLMWKSSEHEDWYEWWYFKVVDPKTHKSYYFCYGLVNPWDSTQSRISSKSFVSIGDFSKGKIIEQKWAPQNFQSEIQNVIINIGGQNHINMNELAGSIVNEKGERASWNLQTTKDWGFNAMGWTMPFEGASGIYWYPVQASLRMSGWIEINGERIEIQDAPGYQDRNWGKTFPPWWAWIVSNNFKNSPGTVLASGGGRPRIFNQFAVADGYTIGLRHKDKVYEFRFPDGDRINLDIKFGQWHVDAVNGRNQRVVIDASAPKEKFMVLPFMTPQGQVFKDYETLNGRVRIKVYERNFLLTPWKLVADLESDEAGIEYGSFDDQKTWNNLFNSKVRLY